MRAQTAEQLDMLRWPADRLRVERTRRLREIVAHARRHSPWHADRLSRLDVASLTEDTLDQIPVMTKDDLMDNFDRVVTDPRLTLEAVQRHVDGLKSQDRYLFDTYHVVASGGSTGRVGWFIYDWEGWTSCYFSILAYLVRALRKKAWPEPVVFVAVMADVARHMTSSLTQTFSHPGLDMRRVPVTQPWPDIVAGLNALQPTILCGYPSALQVLVQEAHAGRLRVSPSYLVSGAEPLLPDTRRAVQEAWSIPVWNIYSSSEVGGTAAACDEGDRLHLHDHLVIVEPVDENGLPVPAGTQSAKLYVTSLYNRVQPIIRYELTDQLTILEGWCSCGSGHRTVADIHGRSNESFQYPNGVRVHPVSIFSQLEKEFNIAEYQVRQTSRGADIAIRCAGQVHVDRLRADIEQALAQVGVPEPLVGIELVEELQRQETGKLKRFVPLPVVDAARGKS